MEENKYVIAVRRGQETHAPADWQARLAAIEGVSMQGFTETQAQFFASPETIQKVKSQLGVGFSIEEVFERGPL